MHLPDFTGVVKTVSHCSARGGDKHRKQTRSFMDLLSAPTLQAESWGTYPAAHTQMLQRKGAEPSPAPCLG